MSATGALLSAATRRRLRLRSLPSSSSSSPLTMRPLLMCQQSSDYAPPTSQQRHGHYQHHNYYSSTVAAPALFSSIATSSPPLHSSHHHYDVSSWSASTTTTTTATSQSYHRTTINNNSTTKRSFATKKKQKKDVNVYKQQLKSNTTQSIIGKRPGQTSFSPPKNRTLSHHQPTTKPSESSSSSSMHPISPEMKPMKQQQQQNQQVKPKSSSITASSTTQQKMPLILPPSVSETVTAQQKVVDNHDNKDHAHIQPSIASAINNNNNNDDNTNNNPLRNMFLQQGILPPPPRPVIAVNNDMGGGGKKKSVMNDPNNNNEEVIIIPEPHPSGVSHANPEDILDMASMYEPSIHLPDKPNFNSPRNRAKYEVGTPMTQELIAYIGVRGPITVAEFMRRVLRDGEYGYYTGKGARSGKKKGLVAGGDGGEGAAAVEEDDVFDDDDWDLDNDDEDTTPTNDDSTQHQQHVGGEHVIGSGGDFITAPEVSQLFGESLLVWLMTQYQTLNCPSKIQIIEIGPGKGTLICDIVRSAVNTFPDFASALTTAAATATTTTNVVEAVEEENKKRRKQVAVGVHLVEVTNGMRARQKESLQNLQKERDIMEKGYSFQFEDANKAFSDEMEGVDEALLADESISLASSMGGDAVEKGNMDQPSSSSDGSISSSNNNQDANSITVSWHDVLSSVPTHDATTGEPIPTFIICQELMDALPIHSFQKIEGNVWRERLVDCAIRDESEASDSAEDIAAAAAARYANAETTDDAKSALVQPSSSTSSNPTSSSSESNNSKQKIPRLRFVLPPDTTPALRTILRVNNRGSPADEDNPTAKSLDSLPVGSIIEACPEGLVLAQDIAARIEKCQGGAALIIDYGGDGMSGGDTLRGFWKHTQVHPLSRPGEVDVTADVDFGALREAVNRRVGLEESLERMRRQSGLASSSTVPEQQTLGKSKAQKPEAFGPISQGKFLAQMGVVQRVEKKILDDTTTDEKADEIYSAMERLMAPEQMGERYKVLAIAAKKEGLFPPPGF